MEKARAVLQVVWLHILDNLDDPLKYTPLLRF